MEGATIGQLAHAGAIREANTEGQRVPGTTPGQVRDSLLIGVPFIVVAALCLLLLPARHSLNPAGAAIGLALFIMALTFDLRVAGSWWFGCTEAPFVLLLFSLPLNVVPAVSYLCFMVRYFLRRRSRWWWPLRAAANSWFPVPPVLVLAVAAPGRAEWAHWPIYVAAFLSQFIVHDGLLTSYRRRLVGFGGSIREQMRGSAVDAALTPVGLMAAINVAAAPVGTAAMLVGVVALVALLCQEQRHRLVQTERALRDPLTGLANRALFSELLEQCQQRCERQHVQAGLLLLDLDDFKQINDTLGHQQGDDVLCLVADRLRRATRASDTVARLGGDEFAVILAEPITLDDANAIARKLGQALAEPMTLATGASLPIRSSIGAAVFGDRASAHDAIGHADARLYDDKRTRKQSPGRRAGVRADSAR